MDDDSSTHSVPSSFTESLEASMEIEGHYSQILSFSCVSDLKSEGKSFSPDSYLASGSLKRYVKPKMLLMGLLF